MGDGPLARIELRWRPSCGKQVACWRAGVANGRLTWRARSGAAAGCCWSSCTTTCRRRVVLQLTTDT
eukprot:3074031-Prymnesium_polylepis.1